MDHTLPKLKHVARVLVSVAVLTAVALLVALIPSTDVAYAASLKDERPELVDDKSVPGTDHVPKKRSRPDDAARPHTPGATSWPAGRTVTPVTPAGETPAKEQAPLLGEKAGRVPGLRTDLPVAARPAGKAAARAAAEGPAAHVAVEIADRAAAREAGVPDGLLLTVAPAEPGLLARSADLDATPAEGTVRVELDYSAYEKNFGADWGSRLGLVDLATGDEVTTANDTADRTLTGEITLPKSASAAPVTLAAVASAGGAGGNYGATSLSPSGSWMAGSSSGGFSWSYPVDVPETPGGPAPDIEIGYSSQAVDGRTASTNSQSSWIAEGWDWEPGFIERRYRPCADDQGSGANNPGESGKTGDLCWGTEQMVMSLDGSSNELVKDDKTGVWRPADDDGTRLERKTGAENGAYKGEYWVLTTTDGTQYHFGLNKLPGAGSQRTHSVLTVPVAGNHPGEDCHASAFASSFCTQGWRWMLDQVVDPLGDAMTVWWTKETNRYGQNDKPAGVTYDRAAYPHRIDYGQRADKLFTSDPAARVEFGVTERCVPTEAFACAEADRKAANAKHWPDTPLDQQCLPGEECKNKNTPTFWSTKRLVKITTKVLAGSTLRPVDTFTLDQSFPATGDGTSPALWLKSVGRTGHAADGATADMPKVTFRGQQLDNRVDGFEGLEPFSRLRVQAVDTETGGTIGVTYSDAECSARAPVKLPASPHTNTMRCYPQFWTPKGATDPVQDWFHKYVVTKVREEDNVAGARATVTSYEYLGGAAWAYDDSEHTAAKERTWSQYRGYERVRTRVGDTSDGDPQQLTEHRYFRGMHGDKLPSGTRTASVTDSEGGTHPDRTEFQGQLREEITYDAVGGSVDSAVKVTPSAVKTASRARTGTTALEAWMVHPVTSETRELVKGDTYRRSTETTAYDSYGMPTKVEEKTAGGRLVCTLTSYVRDTDAYIVDTESREVTRNGACDDASATVIDDTRSLYDGGAFGDKPTKGLVTEVQELDVDGKSYTTTDRTAYDLHGRETATWDAEDNKTTVAFTPATVAVPHTQVTTDPLGHTETTEFDVQRGLSTADIGPNGERVDMEYDPLGRLLKVWDIDRDKTKAPNARYQYAITKTKPTVVTNETLKDDGSYAVSHEILDGHLRVRQTQDPAVGGEGRIVNDTFYDSAGRELVTNDGYYNDQPVSTTILVVGDNVVPSQNRVTYDGSGEAVREVSYAYGEETTRTTLEKDGDASTVVPPEGDTVTTTYTDAEGRQSRLREYTKKDRSAWRDTTYHYDALDQLTRIVEPGGAEYTFSYDARGRQTATTDPDGGRTTYEFDATDNLVATTNPNGERLVTTYDKAGRPTSLREDSADGRKRLEWTYDTLGKGLPTAAIRYDDEGNAHREEITSYDKANRPLATRTTISAAAGKVAGTYDYRYDYTDTGNLAWVQLPKAGNLASERLVFRYTTTDDLPLSITGNTTYVAGVTYSRFGEVLRTEAGPAGRKLFSSYYYDEFSRQLTRTVHDRGVQPALIDDTGYTYDDAGNLTSIKRTPGQGMPDGQAGPDTQCFVYDQLRRMTSAWTAADDTCTGGPGKATVGGDQPYWHSYTFDDSGNRTALTEHDPAGNTAKDIKRTYSYGGEADGPNRLAEVASEGPGGTTRSVYGYDKAGNTTTRQRNGTTQTLKWDPEGALTEVSEPVEGGTTKTTKYLNDASGERLLRHGPDGSTTLYLGETELTAKPDGTTTTERFYSHPDGSTTVRSSDGGLQVLLADHHGSTQTSVDMTQASMPVTRRQLTPFGEDRGEAPSRWPGGRGFVGGLKDEDTGLTQLGARPYDPATGRFLSVDPMVDFTDPATINPYAYANNAPATFSDPDGLFFPILVGIAARIAIRAAIRAAARAAAKRAARIAARKAAQRRARALAKARARAAAKARAKARA
ncbi:RHS repeat domain-containing protein, partial [Streptomyces albidoflavus]